MRIYIYIDAVYHYEPNSYWNCKANLSNPIVGNLHIDNLLYQNRPKPHLNRRWPPDRTPVQRRWCREIRVERLDLFWDPLGLSEKGKPAKIQWLNFFFQSQICLFLGSSYLWTNPFADALGRWLDQHQDYFNRTYDTYDKLILVEKPMVALK